MKKKLLSLLLVAAMGVTALVGCGGTTDEKLDYTGVEIKVWCPDATVELTQKAVEDWKAANPDMAAVKVNVEAMGEGDAATSMVTDVTAGADIYSFAQDQLARLVTAQAIMPVANYTDTVKKNNDTGSVGAATVGDTVYAFPITSDNGYFLYYDKSVVTDPSTLDGILAACEGAGKSFYFNNEDAWYNASFFFAMGCKADYTTNDKGAFASSNITYASKEGVAAVKAMIAMHKSPAFVNGSSVSDTTNAAAIVTGVWDKVAAETLFGENFACAKLPTFTADGKQVQMSGMGGYKLIGVKPQTEKAKQQACLSLANHLSSEEVQLARFDALGWGPSNLNAQANEKVASDPTLKALAEQMAFMVPQGQYPNDFWTDVKAFGSSVNTGEFDNLSDDELLTKLQELQTKLESYAKAE